MFFYLFGQLSWFHIPDKISLVEIVSCSGDGEVSVEVVYQTEMGGSILLFINQDISAIFRTVFPPEIIIDHEVIRESVV